MIRDHRYLASRPRRPVAEFVAEFVAGRLGRLRRRIAGWLGKSAALLPPPAIVDRELFESVERLRRRVGISGLLRHLAWVSDHQGLAQTADDIRFVLETAENEETAR